MQEETAVLWAFNYLFSVSNHCELLNWLTHIEIKKKGFNDLITVLNRMMWSSPMLILVSSMQLLIVIKCEENYLLLNNKNVFQKSTV